MTRRRLVVTAAALTVVIAALAGLAGVAQSPGRTDDASGGEPAWRRGTSPITTPWTADVGPGNALPEYPRPQLTREAWQNLNGVWEFTGAEPGEAPPVGRTLDERVLVPYPIESALSGIQRRDERMWYRRTFTVPAAWTGQRLMLHFGAVDYDSAVYVNGTKVATHRGGYDKFSVDVTDALRGTGPQELIVWAEDLTDATGQPVGKQRRQSGRDVFYQGSSGIWQTVWMEPVPASHVAHLEMTPDVDAGALRLTAVASSSSGTNDADLRVRAVARDADGDVVGTASGAANSELTLPVRTPRLWSPDDPYLYDLEVSLLDAETPVDDVTSYFGLRKIGTKAGADGQLRMTLNDEILFTLASMDHGFWPDGLNTAPTDAALRFDLQAQKDLGFNAVRKHVKVEPDRWYYWADRLGLMVWQDMPSTTTGPTPPEWRTQFVSELTEMVREHASWTSIVGWVPFNAGWGEWDRRATGRIADQVKAQDPSRLVNAESGTTPGNDSGRGDVIDYQQFPGPAAPRPDATRISMDGAHGGFGLEVPGHLQFGEGSANRMATDSANLTASYVENQRAVTIAAQRCGISSAVYAQFSDVERQVDGFYTYDRRVAKMDFAQVREVNERIIRDADGSAGGSPPPPAGTPGLAGVASYPLDSTAEDAVGDRDATLVGNPGYVAAKRGSGVELNGSPQYIDTGAPLLDTSRDYSASAWVKLDRVDDGFQTVVSQDGAAASDFFLQYAGTERRFAMTFVGIRTLGPDTPVVGRWYHLAGVRDSVKGELRLYVDGALAGTSKACLSVASPSGNTVIGRGRFQGKPADYVDGTVDQVRLYDRALSAAEVTKLYTSGG
ncbi:MAG: LamG-like jellyroll fold domain-containing protein [Dermatophilaceae bacterium]